MLIHVATPALLAGLVLAKGKFPQKTPTPTLHSHAQTTGIVLPVATSDPFVKDLRIPYEGDSVTGCPGETQPRPKPKAALQPTKGITVPRSGLFYGYSSYDPSKIVKCDYKWYQPNNDQKQCPENKKVVWPKDSSCCVMKKWSDKEQCVPTDGEAAKCIIMDNLVAEGPLVLKMPANSFLGIRGMLVAPPTGAGPRPKFIDYTPGPNSIFAGAPGSLIYMQGEAYFTGVRSNLTYRVIDITGANGLLISGVTIIQANQPSWHILGSNVTMENCNIIVASTLGYPSLSRNADGFQIAVDGFVLRNSFIQSGDDAIALKRTNKALFECLQIRYSHGLAIGSVSANDSVSNVIFRHIELVGSEFGARVKAKKFETGDVRDVLFESIKMHEMNYSAIAVRQDYIDPLPDGLPDSDVRFQGIHFSKISATVKNRDPEANTNSIIVLCSHGKKTKGGCKHITFDNIDIKGSDKPYPPWFVNFRAPRSLLKSGIDVFNVTSYDATGGKGSGGNATTSRSVLHRGRAKLSKHSNSTKLKKHKKHEGGVHKSKHTPKLENHWE